jgi:hypothetical protein
VRVISAARCISMYLCSLWYGILIYKTTAVRMWLCWSLCRFTSIRVSKRQTDRQTVQIFLLDGFRRTLNNM